MKEISVLYILLLSVLLQASAQSVDDYRSSGSGSWTNSSTWERFDGAMWLPAPAAPNASNGVITIRSPHTVLVVTTSSGDQVIVESGGALSITSTFTLSDGPGIDINVLGTMQFNSGTLLGSGTIHTENSGTLQFSTSDVKTTSAGITFTNDGMMLWDEGGINGAAPVINNNIFTITANALWQFSGGLTNNGTINKSAGATTIATPWSNSGTINLSGGTLTSSASFTNTGTISLSSGAAWQNNSTFTHSGGGITGTGSFTNAGTLTLDVDQTFPSTLIFSNSGTINGPGALNIHNDFVIQGTITGGTMTLNGNGEWRGGTLGRALTINAGKTLLITTSDVKTSNSGATITNNGTMIWDQGGINGGGAIVNNNLFTISATALWQLSGGLTNNGTINKSAGATTIATPWSNSGTINLSGGTLTSSAPFTNTGTISLSSGAAWQNNSTFTHSGATITGTGSFANAGTLTLDVDQTFPSTLIFSNSGTINGPGALNINNDFVIQGTITGGTMTLNGNGEWRGGTLGRALTINAGKTLLITTSDVKTSNSGATITNNGTMIWDQGGINGGGAIVNNNLFTISATAFWQFSGGLINHGTINKSGGGTTIGTPWSNTGTINLTGGTLTSSAPFTNTGTIAFSSGAVWQNNSSFDHSGAMMSGTGSFINAGTLTLAVDQTFSSTLTLSHTGTINGPGALHINHDFVIQGTITGGPMTLNGNAEWRGGTFGRSVTINSGKTLLITTPEVKTSLAGSTITNNGTITWDEGGINGGGAVINNQILDISANALWQFGGGITNNGTLSKTTLGLTNLSTPVVNTSSGIIRGIGAFSFSDLTNSGVLAPGLSPGQLTVDGANPLSVSSTLQIEIQDNSGPGAGHDQLVRNGNLTVNGTLEVIETGTVPNGSYTIINLQSGTITGSFSATDLPPGYSVQITASSVILTKNVSLPLTLLSFSAHENHYGQVVLEWRTTAEYNVAHFELEQSTDGINFTHLSVIPALNLPAGAKYRYVDESPFTPMNFYRLRIVDNDASAKLSPLVSVRLTSKTQPLIYPSIAEDIIHVVPDTEATIRIYSTEGFIVLEKQMQERGTLDISALMPGTYFVQAGDTVPVRILKR